MEGKENLYQKSSPLLWQEGDLMEKLRDRAKLQSMCEFNSSLAFSSNAQYVEMLCARKVIYRQVYSFPYL